MAFSWAPSLEAQEAPSFALDNGFEITLVVDALGGNVRDNALMNTAGFENQPFKMVRGIIGARINSPDSGWFGLAEYNLTPDEPKRIEDNRLYNDWYVNLGADLLFYGDIKARNVYFGYQTPGDLFRTKVGRMVNPYGFALDEVPYHHRHDAPHQYYLDKELHSGIQVTVGPEHPVKLDLAVFGGRGRPNKGYNFYRNGKTGPNTKGNVDPLGEAKVTYQPSDRLQVWAGYHLVSTGSAPGDLYSGKHLDEKMALGMKGLLGHEESWPGALAVWGQISRNHLGLRDEGLQPTKTPEKSHEFEKEGWFATAQYRIEPFRLAYTYEVLDRIDPLVWDKVANFDPNHPAFGTKERSQIISLELWFNEAVFLQAYHRRLQNPFPAISGNTREHFEKYGDDRSGLVFGVLM
jgi:hypothetical protein